MTIAILPSAHLRSGISVPLIGAAIFPGACTHSPLTNANVQVRCQSQTVEKRQY